MNVEKATEVMSEIRQTTELLLDAENDTLSPDEQTYEFSFDGETRAEALGHAYHVRDAIRDAGRSCEATLLREIEQDWHDDRTWVVEIHIEAASD
jgi:hypothetical protein